MPAGSNCCCDACLVDVVVATDDGREALLSPGSRLSSTSSSTTSRVTTPEVELSSPASSAPDNDSQQQHQQQQEPLHTMQPPPHQQQQTLPRPPQQQQNQATDTGQQCISQPRSSNIEQAAVRRYSSKQASQPAGQRHDRSVVVHVSPANSSRSPAAYNPVGTDEGMSQGRALPGSGRVRRCSSGVDGEGCGVEHQHMTAMQRLRATCALWPYMVPLFVVYFAEVRLDAALDTGTMWCCAEAGALLPVQKACHSFVLVPLRWMSQLRNR